MKCFVCLVVLSLGLANCQFQDRDDATTIAYQDDIYYVLNEVEQKTADALEASVIILKFKLTANNSEEVIAQRDEIFTKGQNTIVLIKKWIQDNNATGQLVGESEECIEHVLQMTVDDTLEYMNKLRYECWKNDAWLGDIADITANLTELAQKGKDLYGEFLDANVNCIHETNVLACTARVEAETRVKAKALLEARWPYLDVVYAINQGYERGVTVCQKLVYEKIDWIERNAVVGFRDCKPTN